MPDNNNITTAAYQDQVAEHMTPAQIEYENNRALIALDQAKAIANLNNCAAEEKLAVAFKIKSSLILDGMAELRFALNYPVVDSSKESRSDGSIQFKEIFDTPAERDRLKQKYAELMDVYVRIMKQMDPKQQT